jgi:hypothetical protein
VIEYALAACSDMVGWAPAVASPEVVQMVFQMQFTSMDLDDLTAGLSLFLMVGMWARQSVFTMVHAGNVAPTWTS